MTIYCFRDISGKLGFYDPDTRRAVFENSKTREINEPRLGAAAPELGNCPKGIDEDFKITIANLSRDKTKINDAPWYKFKESKMSKKQFDDLYRATVSASLCRKTYLLSLSELQRREGGLFKPNLESSL